MPRLARYVLRQGEPCAITGGLVSEMFGRHYWTRFKARGDGDAIELARAFITVADSSRIRPGDVWELVQTWKSKPGARPVVTFDYPHGDTSEPRALRAPTCEVA